MMSYFTRAYSADATGFVSKLLLKMKGQVFSKCKAVLLYSDAVE